MTNQSLCLRRLKSFSRKGNPAPSGIVPMATYFAIRTFTLTLLLGCAISTNIAAQISVALMAR